jgi:hypothetical protein
MTFISKFQLLISIADAVCAAPKRRFRPYEQPVAKNANATDARKARKGQLKKDESVG